MSSVTHPTLFFDGVCNLCNASIDWVMRHDRQRLFRFASLQGTTAHELVPEYAEEEGLSTVVLLDEKGRHVRSTAALRVLWHLGGLYRFLATVLLVIPSPVRDWGYRQIANRRYKLFGQKDTCRLPTREERALFLP